MFCIAVVIFFVFFISWKFFLFGLFKHYEAKQIVENLEYYKKDHWCYPKNLNELEPDYVKFIYFYYEYRSKKPDTYSIWYKEKEWIISEVIRTYRWNCDNVRGCFYDL